MHFDILFVMRWWIAIVGVLAACNNGGALEIVVEMDPQIDVDRVQLYVGLGDARNSERELLVPSGYAYPERPSGFYWKRDVNGASDVVDVDPGAADVRFVFHEGTDDTVTLVVVGYKAEVVVAAASLVDAQLEAGTVSQYHVKLRPATSATVKPRAAVTVQRWGPGPDDTQCVYLEDAATEERGIYIVEHEDRDCDGFPDEDAKECRPEVWRGRARAVPAKTSCVRTDMLVGPNNTTFMGCVLGGPGCSDGTGMTACEASNVCVPPADCVACATRPDALECVSQLPASSTAATRIQCSFFISPTGAQLCSTEAPLTARLSLPIACDPMQPFNLFVEGGGWKPSTYVKGAMTFTAAMPTPACDFKLSVTNAGAPAGTAARTILMYPLANGRYAAVPLEITVEQASGGMGCDDPQYKTECHVGGELPTAPFVACMMADVIEPW